VVNPVSKIRAFDIDKKTIDENQVKNSLKIMNIVQNQIELTLICHRSGKIDAVKTALSFKGT